MSQTIHIKKSHRLFERAKLIIPGGVNSPARSCQAVGAVPVFIKSADGPYIHDVDGETYIDYVGSWGPMILGHRHPQVMEALENALAFGTSFGAPCAAEVEMAELICKSMENIEMVRMVSSGTEATMSAIRLARAYTKKSTIVKFDGCYHGHADSLLIKAGSGLATLGIASSAGVPEELAKLTVSLPFNDLDAVKKTFKEKKDIAAVILEPIVGNSGLILPQPGFLEGLRELCTANGALLIFDEVMTGFRVALGGAQQLYKIKPDLTCLGKIIGGGLPVGAFGGRKDIMEMVAPLGDVYQAGTLSGNPLAMAAGVAQLKVLQSPLPYKRLEASTARLAEGLNKLVEKADAKKVNMQVAYVTGMITVFFTKEKVTDFEKAKTCDLEVFSKVWHVLMQNGIYWPPSQFEAAFLSVVHSKENIDNTIKAFETAISQL
jgi:glutamate-1-semialdehyde 2,1-aminomutase